jgi:hypothetical protein
MAPVVAVQISFANQSSFVCVQLEHEKAFQNNQLLKCTNDEITDKLVDKMTQSS